jgi:hypothetical protein
VRSVSGRKQRLEGETVGKSGRVSVDSVCLAVEKRVTGGGRGVQSEVESRVHKAVYHLN